MTERCDILIRGGQVIDGTGKARFAADVAIDGDRIAAIGDLAATKAEHTIAANNHIISPGFIDVHTHDDYLLLSNPEVSAKLSQGVTTVVVGNCGVSLSPLQNNRPPPPPLDLLAGNYLPDFAAYRTALERQPAAINSAPLIGHSTLRFGSLGDDCVKRAATDDEIRTMKQQLQESMQAGAIGFSTGLFYPPNMPAPLQEVAELAKELADFKGIYATHMRDEGDGLFAAMDETFETARRAGCPVVISHHKCSSPAVWGKSQQSLAKIEAASKTQAVGFDVYPYVAGSTVLLEKMIEHSKRIIVTWSKAEPDAGGRDLADIAKQWDCSLEQAMQRLQPGGGIYFMMEESDMERILAHPKSMVGSDGIPHDAHPHPRLWGTFPRVLGHFTRERGLFALEEAVRKMTGLSAQTFALRDRGVLQAGAYADVVIFDPDTIADTATFDNPIQPAAGIHTVLVNGVITWQQGAGTGARAGQVLTNPVAA